jgi:DNA polymerase I
MRADLVGICLCVEPGEAAYVPLAHRAAATDDLFGSNDLAEGQMPWMRLYPC